MSLPLLNKTGKGYVTISRNAEVDYILELALDEACRMVRAGEGNLFLYTEEGKLFAFREDLHSSEAEALALESLKTRSSKNIIPESAIGPEEQLKEGEEAGQKASLAIVLSSQDGEIGAIVLRKPLYFEKFYENDLNLVRNFAATFAILLKSSYVDTPNLRLNFKSSLLLLLENAHLNQKVKESGYQLKTVLEVSNVINSSRELNEMIQVVLLSARRVIHAESASVFLNDESTGEMVFDVISGEQTQLRGMRIPQGQGIVGICAREKRSIIVNDAQNDPRLFKKVDEVAQNVTRNLMACPLVVSDRVIGVIEVLNTIDRADFTQQDLEIFESFSDSVAIALQRRMLLDDLQSTNEQLEKKLREVTSLHSVARILVDAHSIEELFANVLHVICEDMKAGRASFLLKNSHGELEVVAKQGEYSEDVSLYTFELSARVMEQGNPLFVEDFGDDPSLAQIEKPDLYDSRSCIIIPMKASSSEEPFGLLCVADPETGSFTREDFLLLSTIVSQTMRGYENFKLNEELLAKRAIEKEVEITSKIQKNILPSRIPFHQYMELGARSIMARTTGGDFYDYHVHSDDGEVTMLVADVSGKSLPAALFMAVSSSILRTIIRTERNPAEILRQANDLLYEESESGMFVTVFLARYNPANGTLRYASAGHNEMLLVRKDGDTEVLNSRGAPLGVIPSGTGKFESRETQVNNGDLLILYTDGVVEAINLQNEEYGLDNFRGLLEQNRSLPATQLIDLVYKNVTSFAESDLQYDDFTMLVTRLYRDLKGQNFEFRFPARASSVPLLRDEITRILEANNVTGQDQEDILLVSDEAATNIILHAFEESKILEPDFLCKVQIGQGRLLRMEFEDRGRPFDIDEVAQPDVNENLAGRRKGGFGVFLIRSLMDKVQYRREGGVNYLRMEKKV